MQCSKCRFFNKESCAVNPLYWQAFHVLNNYSSLKRQVEPFLIECNQFEPAPLKPMTITLTEAQWQAVLDWCLSNDDLKTFSTFQSQVREGLGIVMPSESKDIESIPF